MSFDLLRAVDEVNGKYSDGFIMSENEEAVYGFKRGNFLLINGDQEASEFFFEDKNAVTISFRCLGRFMTGGAEPSVDSIVKALDNIHNVSYTQDEIIKGKKGSKQPDPGFVWIEWSNQWHRSATVLITTYDREYNSISVLMGMDENQYFGCQLPGVCKTIQEAYTMLMPKHIRGVDPSNIARQGEWFFIHIEDDPMSFEGAEKFKINYQDDEIQYYLRGRNDNEDSNTHVVNSSEYVLVDDTYGLNNGKKIPIFKNAIVYHNQHEVLDLKGWWWAVENTAIVSYSEEGVD